MTVKSSTVKISFCASMENTLNKIDLQNDQNLQKTNNQRNQQRPHWEPKSKSDMRPNLIEQSRGSTLFSVSRRGEFPLR